MKLHKIRIVYSCLGVLLFSSCSDFLNEKVYTQPTSDYIVSTPSGMSSAVLAMYYKDRELFRNNGDGESALALALLMGDDITVPRAGEGVPQFGRYNNLLPANAIVGRLWRQMYAMINYANQIIDAADRVNMEDPIAIQAVAEARVFRAHSYLRLLQRFDRIYLTTRVTTPENVNDSIVYTPSNPADVYQLIDEDLDWAIANLDWETKDAGRFTQGVARHLKAKAAAWQENWSEVAAQVNAIEQSGYYTLLPQVSDVFKGADLNHSEAILVSQWSKGVGGWYVSPTMGTTSGHRMSLHFTPLYNQEQGMRIDYESGGYAWGRLFPNQHLFDLYDQAKDERYTAFYKTTWTYNNAESLPRGKKFGDVLVPSNSAQYLNVHPMCTKYMDSYTKSSAEEMQSYKDIIIYRLPETYLLGAEAYVHLGKSDSAQYYYNKTWTRAGNDAETRAITIEMIADEHARELAMEGDRWNFLKRNNMLLDNVRKYGGEYLTNDKGVVLMNDTIIRTNIQPHHVRWPIPQAQIDIMGKDGFSQNEGY